MATSSARDTMQSPERQGSGSVLSGAVLLDQTFNGRRKLSAVLDPIRYAVLRETQVLDASLADGVVKAQTLNETPIAAVAGIGSNYVIERALLRAATGQTNYN